MESEIFISLFRPYWLKGLFCLIKKTETFGQYSEGLVRENGPYRFNYLN